MVRDEAETVLRAWHAYEVRRGGSPVIDFDCHPVDADVEPAGDRLEVYQRLTELRDRADEDCLAGRLDADIAYLGALLGERRPLAEYVQVTQGCGAAGWSPEYVRARGEQAREALAELGVNWGPGTGDDMNEVEGPLGLEDAPDAIRKTSDQLEPAVREATGSTAPFELDIETANVDAYWAYWLDGAGHRVRLRLNLRNAVFTKVGARRFALHEVLGHGLQSSSWTETAKTSAPWIRLMSVHALQQVLLEGLAQALPLFVIPDDQVLTARIRLDHFIQLVRAELHLGLEDGVPIRDLADHARSRIPWWSDAVIADTLTDRGSPQLRTYLWSYPAGIDWFVHLAEADPATRRKVLHAAYARPLTPADLVSLWPDGPKIGGPGR
ncbi:hypothetical protein AGRA3207_004627 [Actinomadura graeca]|uniref:DUF885 domain-containing protein n=1 Tax=Actinomadura graeca TaxID=2750812 RepID=A0ABX8R182_9ACTN|nr:hypothetical protein [Actinomadura graeca]QXJ23472.1 hypothetical protein AGRA3207_004627 [Actinomadura graeca]